MSILQKQEQYTNKGGLKPKERSLSMKFDLCSFGAVFFLLGTYRS